jgi:hypothetical protein
VSLSGEASTASFRLDKAVVDFGRLPFDAVETRDLTLTNTGKVEYSFTVAPMIKPVKAAEPIATAGALSASASAILPDRIAVSPATGTLGPGEKVKITVRVKPGLPGGISERLRVSVAHFEPVDVRVEGQAVFGSLVCSLPLQDAAAHPGQAEWVSAYEEAATTVAVRQAEIEASLARPATAGSVSTGSPTPRGRAPAPTPAVAAAELKATAAAGAVSGVAFARSVPAQVQMETASLLFARMLLGAAASVQVPPPPAKGGSRPAAPRRGAGSTVSLSDTAASGAAGAGAGPARSPSPSHSVGEGGAREEKKDDDARGSVAGR